MDIAAWLDGLGLGQYGPARRRTLRHIGARRLRVVGDRAGTSARRALFTGQRRGISTGRAREDEDAFCRRA